MFAFMWKTEVLKYMLIQNTLWDAENSYAESELGNVLKIPAWQLFPSSPASGGETGVDAQALDQEAL